MAAMAAPTSSAGNTASATAPLGRALPAAGFATLVLIAFMFGANHVAARLAFDHGVDVMTAVCIRSGVTAIVVALILWRLHVPMAFEGKHRWALPAIALLIAAQSYCLYSAVARLPVALALLVFNLFPLTTAAWARVLYRERAEPAVLVAMPILLVGLALALDVMGAASGLGATAHWGRIGAGVAFGVAAAAIFGLALVLTQHEARSLDGRVRTFTTMAGVGVIALVIVIGQGGFALPNAAPGWWGLVALTVLYGTAFTIMFTVLPRLGVVGNSAIMNVEPVFALVLAWALLEQRIAPVQVAGALIVVGGVMWLGLRKR
jgi:drug/metabolite transporter (DMT)-like permease